MMTSNRPIEEWGRLLSDVPAASAILDRLLHHAEVIPITGRSYRLQERASENKAGARAPQNPQQQQNPPASNGGKTMGMRVFVWADLFTSR